MVFFGASHFHQEAVGVSLDSLAGGRNNFPRQGLFGDSAGAPEVELLPLGRGIKARRGAES